ncbi:hypothetical protein QFZ83_006425 [Variovorax sp. W1I1]|nr:hypothetical protein [Variovorax sp. W1I1]
MNSELTPVRLGGARTLLRGLVVACTLVLSSLPSYAGSVSYTYDALGRMATAVYNNGTTSTTITYSYDAAGNRTSVATTTP